MAPPGAGLPKPELMAARLIFRWKRSRSNREKAASDLRNQTERILRLARSCDAAVGRQDHVIVAWMERDLVHRHGREISLDPDPRSSPIGGDEEAVLGAEVKHVLVLQVLGDGPHYDPGRQIGCDGAERRPQGAFVLSFGGPWFCCAALSICLPRLNASLRLASVR